MNVLKCSNEFESLNEYIRHEQYKFIYKHPLFIKYGNKKGFNFICNKEIIRTTKYSVIITLLLLLSTCLSIGYHNFILTMSLASLSTFSFINGLSHFLFSREKLWRKLEKDFLQENINNNNIVNMLNFLTIEQKEGILDFIRNRDSITFNDLIKMFENLHNKIEKEKIILTLNK